MLNKNKKKKEKSLRTIVGSEEFSDRTYILSTNDSLKFFGLFVLISDLDGTNKEITEGTVEKRFCIDFIESRLSQYTDIYMGNREGLDILLSSILNSLYQKIYEERGFFPFDIIVSFSIGNSIYFARIGNMSAYRIRDRIIDKIYLESNTNSKNVDIKKVEVSDGDCIFLCSKGTSNCINKNEIRRHILYADSMDKASLELANLSERYGEKVNKSNIVIKFVNSSREKGIFLTNKAIAIYILSLFLIGFFLIAGDVVKIIGEQKSSEIFRKRSGIIGLAQTIKRITPWETKYLLVTEGFSVPYDIAEGKDKKIYVVDDRENDIIILEPLTGKIKKLNSEINLIFPTSIRATDESIYVVDFSILNSYIFQLDYKGKLIKKVPVYMDEIKLKNPKSIDFDEKGNWYVCDRGNNRIIIFDNLGRFSKEYSLRKFTSPNGIAYWKEGIVFYTSKDTGLLIKLNSDGEEEIIKLFYKNEELKLNEPSSIAIDRKQNLFIADTLNNRIIKANMQGKVLEIIDKDKLEGLGSFPPKSVKVGKYSGCIFIVGSRTNNYNELNKNFCKGRLWEVIY